MPAPLSDPSLLDRLVERLQSKETLGLEFKSAQGGIGKAVWETASAFANTSGGWLILGVNDDGEPLGVGDGHKRSQQFLDQVRNPSKISNAVCGAHDVEIQQVNGNDLIVIRIPASALRDRPVYVGRNPYEGTFIRRGEGDYRCTKPEVDRMMREASDVAADSTVLRGYGLADLDEDTLSSYRRRYQTEHPTSPDVGLDDIGFLKAIGGWRRERERNEEGLTVAGLLLCGKGEAIRDWRGRHLIDYRLLDEENLEQRWLDRVTWEGNLLGAVDTLFPRLVEGVDVPFRLAGTTRQDQTPVHTAVREALVNLLVHADYSETAASLVLRSPSGYQFRNPGSSRVSEPDLYAANRSEPRNPTLVRMFRRIGLAEEAGTGIPTILKAWRDLGYRLPEIQSERYEFMLTLRHAHLFSEGDRNWLEALDRDWTEAEQVALIFARHEQTIDNERLRGLAGLHPTDATKLLVKLRDAGHLTMEGERRGARYRLSAEALALIPDERQADLGFTVEERHVPPKESVGDSRLSLGDSQSNLDDSDRSLDDSDRSLGDSRFNLRDLPPELWTFASQFSEIVSAFVGRSWVPSPERDDVVLRLCDVTPLSAREIATLLQRDPQTARVSVRSLVRRGKLKQVYPERSDPRQRYRTVSLTK